jgi:hypothetical protein
VEGTLTIWQLQDNPAEDLQHPDRHFEVYGNEWIMIENALDVIGSADPFYYHFRVEFYIDTENQPLNIDTVMVFN